MKLAVIGTGYVGLVSGACLAERGHAVTCMDVDAKKIERLRRGEIPIHEPGLAEIVAQNVARGRLAFTPVADDAVPGAEAILLAVGTPPAADGSADLSFLFQAVDEIARLADRDAVVVTKSTVPVGTQRNIRERLAASGRRDIAVASNPEMLREAHAVQDFLQPSRIVMGVDAPRAVEALERLYASWECPKLRMSPASAELTKYAANAFLATKISYANEIAQLAEAVGAEVTDVMRGIGSDPRIGKDFLHAGLGWGGSCFPKDISALQRTAEAQGLGLPIVSAALEMNRRAYERAVGRLEQALGGLSGKTVALLGLAFKGGTDDTRSSPAVAFLRTLLSRGAAVRAYDPKAVLLGEDAALVFFRASDPYEAMAQAEALVIATEWDEFRLLDLDRVKRTLHGSVVLDARNLLDPEAVRRAGLVYLGVGRA